MEDVQHFKVVIFQELIRLCLKGKEEALRTVENVHIRELACDQGQMGLVINQLTLDFGARDGSELPAADSKTSGWQ